MKPDKAGVCPWWVQCGRRLRGKAGRCDGGRVGGGQDSAKGGCWLMPSLAQPKQRDSQRGGRLRELALAI
jgi:hypothetical protein